MNKQTTRRATLGRLVAGLGALIVPTRRSFGAPSRQSRPMAEFIPFELVADTVILALRIGSLPVNVVLDSGALGSAIDLRLANRLNILTAEERRVRGVDGVAKLARTSAFDVAFGEQIVNFAKAIAFDLSEISSTMGRDIHLVVGKEIFFRFAVELDFQQHRMALREPGSEPDFERPRELAIVFGDLHEPMISIAIEGNPPVLAICDLGNGSPLLISRAYAVQNQLLAGRRASSAAIAGVQGVTESTSIIVRSVTLAGTKVAQVPAEILENWQSSRASANVGLPILSRFRLLVDFASSKIWMAESPTLLARPFDIDRSGLGYSITPKSLIVRHVARGSPAEKGQWKAGDVIVAVDDRPIDAAYAVEARARWRYRSPGTQVKLRLLNGEARVIVLSTYY